MSLSGQLAEDMKTCFKHIESPIQRGNIQDWEESSNSRDSGNSPTKVYTSVARSSNDSPEAEVYRIGLLINKRQQNKQTQKNLNGKEEENHRVSAPKKSERNVSRKAAWQLTNAEQGNESWKLS
jgi:hypothetical protein